MPISGPFCWKRECWRCRDSLSRRRAPSSSLSTQGTPPSPDAPPRHTQGSLAGLLSVQSRAPSPTQDLSTVLGCRSLPARPCWVCKQRFSTEGYTVRNWATSPQPHSNILASAKPGREKLPEISPKALLLMGTLLTPSLVGTLHMSPQEQGTFSQAKTWVHRH